MRLLFLGEDMNVELFEDFFEDFTEINNEDKKYLLQNTFYKEYEKGITIHDGSGCSGVILVKSGTLRVYISSEDGKDITIFRLHEGDICMLSASCVSTSIAFDVSIDTEDDVSLYLISGPAFAYVADKNPKVKIYALEATINHFSDAMWVIQQILFMSLDKRLAIFLLDEVNRLGTTEINLTHEQIAKYIGSAREVVSRVLKYFANEGIVEVYRKSIKVLDKNKLKKFL